LVSNTGKDGIVDAQGVVQSHCAGVAVSMTIKDSAPAT
jgi:hypothetical protein